MSGDATTSQGRTHAPLRTSKAVRTRGRVLEAARTIFERDGLIEARVADIASAAGVAHGTFYTYFDSKHDAFATIVEEFFGQIRAVIQASHTEPASTPYESIYRENHAYIMILHDNAKLLALIRSHTFGASEELSARLQEEIDYFIERAERSIRAFHERGIGFSDVEPRYVALALGSMIEQFCIKWFTGGLDLEIETAAQVITDIWGRAIGIDVPQH